LAISALDFDDRDISPTENTIVLDSTLIGPNKRATELLREDISLQSDASISSLNTAKPSKKIPAKKTKTPAMTSKLKQKTAPKKALETNTKPKLEVEPQLSDKTLITGWVHDETGAGVPQQIIQLRSPTHENQLLETTSDPNGTFTLEAAPIAEDYRVIIRPTGPYELKHKRPITLNVFKGMPNLNIPMLSTGAGTIGLTIHTTSGYPVKEQSFQLISLNRVIDQQHSNALGYVEFNNVPATGGRPNLKIRSTGSPIYIFSNLSLTRGQTNTTLHTQAHHGEHSLLVKVKNVKGVRIGDINAKLSWTKTINGILTETIRVIDNSRNGRNEIPRKQQQASNPERTLIKFTGLGAGEHRLDLLGPQTEASYGEPLIVNQYEQHADITMQSFGSLLNKQQ
jgi:hypothetical protein